MFNSKNDKYEELYYAAEHTRDLAYAPYSGFKVGAALLVRPGEDAIIPKNKIYTGVNIENSSFEATICAERVAFAKAISDGVLENIEDKKTPFIAIAISAGDEQEAVPCGICRQFMYEFAPNLDVITKTNGVIRTRNLKELFSDGFELKK